MRIVARGDRRAVGIMSAPRRGIILTLPREADEIAPRVPGRGRVVTVRERKRNPHQCGACGTRFDVTYFDERGGSRDVGTALVEVPCPGCGRPRSMALPVGAEKTLLVEIDEAETDEGGGG
jgi:hypothetical protein